MMVTSKVQMRLNRPFHVHKVTSQSHLGIHTPLWNNVIVSPTIYLRHTAEVPVWTITSGHDQSQWVDIFWFLKTCHGGVAKAGKTAILLTPRRGPRGKRSNSIDRSVENGMEFGVYESDTQWESDAA